MLITHFVRIDSNPWTVGSARRGRKMQPRSTSIENAKQTGDFPIQFSHELSRAIGARRYEQWFAEKTTLEKIEQGVILGVQSPFVVGFIQRRFLGNLQQVTEALLGPDGKCRIEVKSDRGITLRRIALEIAQSHGQPEDIDKDRSNKVPHTVSTNGHCEMPLTNDSRSRARPAANEVAESHKELGKPTLDNFVVGSCNEMAYTAVRQIIEQPGVAYNPLVIYGRVGNGKTHLLQAIHNEYRLRFPKKYAQLQTSESFTNQFTQALREKRLPAFRARFRKVDCLLIDDIGFLESKQGIAEEFLNTIKAIEQQGGQVVVASDRHPRLLTQLSEELSTRMLAGLVCKLEAPTRQTRLDFIHSRAGQLGLEMSTKAANYVAQRFSSSLREIGGVLNVLKTVQVMKRGKKIKLSHAREALTELEREYLKQVRPSDVEQAVCEMFGITLEMLHSKSRTASLTRPRMIAMYLVRCLTNLPYGEIGKHFGGRNHSTVISAEKKVKAWIDGGETMPVKSSQWAISEAIANLERKLLAG